MKAIRHLIAVLSVLAVAGVTHAECAMEVADASKSPQFYPDCPCEDPMTVDFKIAVTCCDCYHGKYTFSGACYKDSDGNFPTQATTNLSLSCDCEECDKTHSTRCSVELKERGDAEPGAGKDGRSEGGGGTPPLLLQAVSAPASASVAPAVSAAGSLTAVPRGAPSWLISLGKDGSGNYSGHFEIDPAVFLTGRPADASLMRIVGNASTGLDIVCDRLGAVRKVMSAQCLAIVNPRDGRSFDLSFYRHCDIDPDAEGPDPYVIRAGAVPYATHEVGPVSREGSDLSLPIVERRPGAVASAVALVTRRNADGSVFWGLSQEGGMREQGIDVLLDGNRREVTRGTGGYEVVVEKTYASVGGASCLIAKVERCGTDVRTTTYEYAEDGSLDALTEPSGLRTEYGYDGAGRRTLVREIAAGRIRETRRSYAPLGVRPHCPDGCAMGIADDDGSIDVATPRVEAVFVDGVVVSRTLRFVSCDTMNHRIVEEVRLVDPAATNLVAEWDSKSNVRTYTDYMPYNRCKPCSELPSLVMHEDGTIDRYAYSAGEYEPGPNGTAGVFTDSYCGEGDWFRTVVTHYAAGDVEIPNVTTRDVKIEIRSSKKILLQEQYVCTAPGAYSRVSWTATTRDDLGQETLVVKSDGTRIEKTYAGRRLIAMADAEGLMTTYTYDALGRVVAETKSGGGFRPDTMTTTTYDPEDRVLSRTVTSGGLSETETYTYDALGRTIATTDAAGIETRYLYATDATAGLETRTTIRAFGTDCAVTNTVVSYADGRTKETRLNGVEKTAYEYGPHWTKTYDGPAGLASPRWSCGYEDALGRTVCETRLGFRGALLITSNEYNTANQLIATRTYSSNSNSELELVPLTFTLICYNSLGQRNLTVSDMNLNSQIDWNDTDRIVSNDTRYVSLSGDWWRESSSWQTRQNGSPELTCVGRSRTRLDEDFGGGNHIHQLRIPGEIVVSVDALGNETTTRTFVNCDTHTTTQTTTTPASSLAAETVACCSLTVSSRSATGVTTSYAYDALGRQVSQTDGRGNTSQIVYDTQGRVAKTIDALGNETTYAYDALGRQTSVTDPLGHTVTTAYDAEGRVLAQRGATYPVDYTYDAYGNKVAMTTYRNEELVDGDTTRWLYDEPSGCMTNKLYADGKGPSYSYTPDGKLARRVWARGIATDYTYDNAGNLTRTEYDDNGVTPTITMSYDRVGNMIEATTAGVVTNLYAYNLVGNCTNEWQNDFNLTRYYDTLGRSTGYAINGTRQTTIAYDTYGRIATMCMAEGRSGVLTASNENEFVWSYLPNTDLKASLLYPNGLTASWQYDANNQLLQVKNATPTNIISQFDYTYDAAGRRTAIAKSGTAFGDLSGSIDSYTYNARSELTSARRTKNGQPIPGFSEDFDYDPIGNRRSSATYNEKGEAQTSTYEANNLNQYTQRTTPGYAAVRGEADPNAFVSINGNEAYRLGSYYFGSDLFDNTAAGGLANLETYATLAQTAANGDETEDLVSSVTNQVYLVQSPETFTYDDDGNQTLITTKTGLWRVTYNGENRPIRWVRDSDNTTLSMSYDRMGRRVTKNAQRFVYDGYLQVANFELVSANSQIPTQNSQLFVWDPTEPVATRPLVWNRDTSSAYYSHDANKNVSEVVADNGEVSAHYEYAPFATILVTIGECASANPWRFSSEYAEDDTGTVYYNYRHYEPIVGRWFNRDPIGEVGGWNVYSYVVNRPMSIADGLGLSCCIGEKRIVAFIYEDASSISRGNPNFDDLRELLKNLEILNYIQLGAAGATGILDGLIAGAGKGVTSVVSSGSDYIAGDQSSPDGGGAVDAIARLYDKLKSFYPKLRGKLYYQECEKRLFFWTHWADKVVGPSEWIAVDINGIDQANPIKTYDEAKTMIDNELLLKFKELLGGGKQ